MQAKRWMQMQQKQKLRQMEIQTHPTTFKKWGRGWVANRTRPIALRLEGIIKALRKKSHSQEFGMIVSVLGAPKDSSSYIKYSKMGNVKCQLFSLAAPWRYNQSTAENIPRYIRLRRLQPSVIVLQEHPSSKEAKRCELYSEFTSS